MWYATARHPVDEIGIRLNWIGLYYLSLYECVDVGTVQTGATNQTHSLLVTDLAYFRVN